MRQREVEPIRQTPKEAEYSNGRRIDLLPKLARLATAARKHPLVAIQALSAIGGGSYGIYTGVKLFSEQNTTPAPYSESIDSVPNNSFNNDGSIPQIEGLPPPHLEQASKVDPDEVFDNSATRGKITPQNSLMIDDAEAIKHMRATPSQSNPNHDVFLLMPRLGPLPKEGITYRKDLTGKNAYNPIYAPEARQHAIENGVNNKIFIKVQKGDVIPVPVPGPNVEFMYDRIRNDLPKGTLDSATLFFKDDNGILHQVSISDASGKPLAPLLDINPRGIKDDPKKFLHPTEIGQPLLIILEDGEIMMFTQAWPSGQFGREEIFPGNVKNVYPTNINLIISPDPSTVKGKVVLVDRRIANTP